MYNTALVLTLAFSLTSSLSIRGLETFHNEQMKNSENRLGIYDGSTASLYSHPYMVGILYSGTFYCAGTILNTNWVITLADCVKNLNIDGITIVANASDGTTGISYQVSQIVTHPNYGSSKLDYDYVLLQTSQNFTFTDYVSAASLPHQETKSNAVLNVLGYGSTGNSNARTLQIGKMTWLAKPTCEKYYSNFGLTWTERMACAYNEGYTTLCSGDYGDPFLRNKVFFGFFIAAAKKGFCSANALPVILADIYPVVEWINSTISP